MAVATFANMQIVPEKFTEYTIQRTTEKSAMVNSGIATADATVGQLINGTPKGGRFITLPFYNDLTGEDEVFGETAVGVEGITTGQARGTLLIRQKAWGATDLAHVLGGSDPMSAITELVSGWWVRREQAIYLAELKAILDSTSGCLKDHVNDISAGSGATACISDGATLDTKQFMGDAYDKLGMVFMHSATYTYLQKNGMITRNPIFDPSQSSVEMERYLGYRIIVDDGMPYIAYEKDDSQGDIDVTTANIGLIQPHCASALVAGTSKVKKLAAPIYDTYFMGTGSFIRQDGMPQGLVGTETDRDKMTATDYLINRRAMIIQPRGISWVPDESTTLTTAADKYPANADLVKPANWKLTTHHKNVPIVALRHKLG